MITFLDTRGTTSRWCCSRPSLTSTSSTSDLVTRARGLQWTTPTLPRTASIPLRSFTRWWRGECWMNFYWTIQRECEGGRNWLTEFSMFIWAEYCKHNSASNSRQMNWCIPSTAVFACVGENWFHANINVPFFQCQKWFLPLSNSPCVDVTLFTWPLIIEWMIPGRFGITCCSQLDRRPRAGAGSRPCSAPPPPPPTWQQGYTCLKEFLK